MTDEHGYNDWFKEAYDKQKTQLLKQKAIRDGKEKANKDFSKGSIFKEIIKKIVKGIKWFIKASK